MNLRKLWPFAGLICVSLFTTASAHAYGKDDRGSSDMEDHQKGHYREITPNAGPRVAHGADVFMEVDFIWWKAVQGGNEFLTSVSEIKEPKLTVIDPKKGASVPRNTFTNVSENWSPGFKVALGLNIAHDGWDVLTRYTWLRSKSNRTLDNHNYYDIYPLPATGVPKVMKPDPSDPAATVPGAIGKVSSHWDLHFNVIDFEVGRNFYLSQFLTMRPFMGLKGTWQDQTLSIETMLEKDNFFEVLYPDSKTAKVYGPYKIEDVMKNGGIGVRTGFNMSWKMTKNWSLYTDLAWTTMFTQYSKLYRKDLLADPKKELVKDGNDLTVLDMDEAGDKKFYALRNLTELEIGMRWETWMSDDNYYLAFQAGWEQQVWNNWGKGFLTSYYRGYDEMLRPHQLTQGSKDLGFHGLNLKLRFDF